VKSWLAWDARMLPAGLGLVAMLLLIATIWPFVAGVPDAEPKGAPAAGQAARLLVPSPADFSLPPLETFSETLNRPLFTATRRPPSPLASLQGDAGPPAPTPPAATGPKGEKLVLGIYLLRGIVVTSDSKLVLLKHATTGKSLRLTEGQKLDDWTVATIAPDHLVLSRGDQKQSVTLHDKN